MLSLSLSYLPPVKHPQLNKCFCPTYQSTGDSNIAVYVKVGGLDLQVCGIWGTVDLVPIILDPQAMAAELAVPENSMATR